MNFAKFQLFVVAAKELGMEFLNVETPVHNRFNLLPEVAPRSEPGTVANPGKHVTFVEITKGVTKNTYHSAFVRKLLNKVRKVKTVLQGNCNAGVSTSNKKGYYILWNFWLNEQGIANLFSIPQLEKDAYLIDYKCL